MGGVERGVDRVATYSLCLGQTPTKIQLNWTGAGLRELCGKAPHRNNALTFCRPGCLKKQLLYEISTVLILTFSSYFVALQKFSMSQVPIRSS